MREIKFRAWDEYRKTMGRVYFLNDVDSDTWEADYDGNPGEPKTGLVIEQFTGVKDNIGKAIYEGDVLRFSNCPGLGDGVASVVFKDSEGCFYVQNDEADVWNPIYDVTDFCLIIGNIHENKELLD